MLPPIAKLLSEVGGTESDFEIAENATMEHAIMSYQSSNKKKCWRKIKKELTREKTAAAPVEDKSINKLEQYTKKPLPTSSSSTDLDIPGLQIQNGLLNSKYSLENGDITTVLWDSESIVFPEIGVGTTVDLHHANVILGTIKNISEQYALSHNIPDTVPVFVANTISNPSNPSLESLLKSDPLSLKAMNPSMSRKSLISEYLPLLAMYKEEGSDSLLRHYAITKIADKDRNDITAATKISPVEQTTEECDCVDELTEEEEEEEELTLGQKVEVRTGTSWTPAVIFEKGEKSFSVTVGEVVWEDIKRQNIRGVPTSPPVYEISQLVDFRKNPHSKWTTGTINDITSTSKEYSYTVISEMDDREIVVAESNLRPFEEPKKASFNKGDKVDYFNEDGDTARWVWATVTSNRYDKQTQSIFYEISLAGAVDVVAEENLVQEHQEYNPSCTVEVASSQGWVEGTIEKYSRSKKEYTVIITALSEVWESVPPWQVRPKIVTVSNEQELSYVNTRSHISHVENIPVGETRHCWSDVLSALPLCVTINGPTGIGRYRTLSELEDHEHHNSISCTVDKIMLKCKDRDQINNLVLRRSKTTPNIWKSKQHILSSESGWWVLYEGEPSENVCELRSKLPLESNPSSADPFDTSVVWRCTSAHRYLSDWVTSPDTRFVPNVVTIRKPAKQLLSLSFKSTSNLKVIESPSDLEILINRTILSVNGVATKTVQGFRQWLHYEELSLLLK
eukprot:TRINITY_DN1319_c9_g1_i1.p1 TRINITY_DN1319_c9_g1~~TRINITY_DN1319_c9_g1_i1.p1  ORF type:complete len:736 (+),score=138.17 TRINITY_DN1319_c9_g1_i1:68-2275(+)